MSEPAFHLLPRPASVRPLGGVARVHELIARLGDGWTRTQTDPSLLPGGYRLRLDQSGLLLSQPPNPREQPHRHAKRILTQLTTRFGASIPCVEIEDEPAFATRGVMLDVSRGRVPTTASLLETIDLLGSLGANHLQLYTEHTFAYQGHATVWHDASPVTPADLRELNARCEARGITLAANQNCFGHLTRWLTHPEYADLAETHGDWDFDGLPRSGPFSLCPTDPRAFEFVRGLLDQLLPHFPSKLVNIGCDEAADVGQGRSGEAVRKRGAGVYADFVARIAREALNRGFRPMFWADIALKRPEALERLPREMIALAWGYEPDAPFDRWCDLLHQAGFETWVCPGTSSWRSFTGRTTERRANIDAAARATEHGASGMLITDWGDLGHRQQWPISLRGIADGLSAAWTGADGAPPDAEAVDLHVFGGSRGVAAWLDELGDADEPLRAATGTPGEDAEPTRLRNASAIFNDLELAATAEHRPGEARLWDETLERLKDLEARVPAAAPPLGDELHHAVRTARVACERAAALRGRASAERLRSVADELDRVSAEHRRLWTIRSRPGGLEESDGYYRRTIDDLRASRAPRTEMMQP